jgi:hypothetical protein
MNGVDTFLIQYEDRHQNLVALDLDGGRAGGLVLGESCAE